MAEQKLLKLKITNTQSLEPGLSATKEFIATGGTIGSSLSSDWYLKDRQGELESTHCRISLIDGCFCITDVSNQTYINDAKMPIGWDKHARLNENDVISLGPYLIRVSIDNSFSDKDQDIEHMLSDSEHLDLFGEELDLTVEEKEFAIDDPLTALDALKHHLDTESLMSVPTLQHSQLDTQSLINTQHQWFGHERTIQADTDSDPTSAISLSGFKYQSNPSEDSKLLTAATYINKDKIMDDKTLDLLEEEMSREFSYSNNQSAVINDENHLLTGPLFRGLGVRTSNSENLAEMQMLSEEMGASLQAAVKGLIELHQQVNTSRYGVMNKNLQPIEDNPLRLGLSYDETVQVMFDNQRSVVHLSAPAAIEESLRTVKDHNEAVHIAINDALNQIIQAFSPEVLMRRFLRYRRPGQVMSQSPESWAWEMYQSYHKELTSNRQHGFEKLFWEIFDQSYDKNLREKQLEV
ncbi:type VI secretion system-associated FHA domain protein TagH [Photobacterium kishitanii]|uniref:type VI secretion system-associated FHA domain protein TagH n=1 Tax=Photobacterium kishitanii TaxID=318456 RepID=UPI0005D3A80E|nr:type VI secretion system-associated FHA domain protein TagH [Photobacterium kishitanii]KJG10595.1 peptide-binding protein [Photobacterium kishitanii]PSU86496.1 type VI secretion system-associated FHA domain protein TagH [Photobacterium kishitanii]PSU90748.1 type VI secretion system-associated FHA domain protein TagH [Photobacterium kishitanii]PSV07916.1 type VI secretion system-associated FHA domain protein TagH [Photobacterium kishitanii]PSV72894.1 type VI secretion system-associated FHA d